MKTSTKIYSIDRQNQKELNIPIIPKHKSFHETLKWVLIIAQCFAQMPVSGIARNDVRHLRLNWRSWRVLYSLVHITGSGLLSFFFIYNAAIKGPTIYNAGHIIFHFGSFLATIFLFKLAKEWPHLMRKWKTVEFAMRGYGWPQHLETRVAVLSFIVLGLGATERVLGKITLFTLTSKCKREDEEFMKYYYTTYFYPDVFQSISYSIWKGVLLSAENLLMVFTWTFNDLIIMLISTGLAARMKQITQRLIVLKRTATRNNVNLWKETREDYNRISQLTKDIGHTLSYVILTSFSSNLFFILIQLFYSLRNTKNTLQKIYFFFSFGFLIIRTVCVCIFGAWIYDESKEPSLILNSVSSDIYNLEIKRFIEQIRFDTVVLTGKNFFHITRGLVLSMAGAIVTYEIVLIQFNHSILKESAMQAINSTNMC